jgi:RND family efflux transporter MFP subunit
MRKPLLWAFVLCVLQPLQSSAKDYDCVVYPARTIKLGSPLTGLLSEVLVERGQHVVRGEVVARLESSIEAATVALYRAQSENKATLEEKEAQLALAQKAVERAHVLAQTQSVSIKQIDEAESDVRVLTLRMENEKRELEQKSIDLACAEAALELKTIRSPVDGVVTERALTGGEYVNQESHIVTVAQIDELRVEAFLPIALYGQVAEGDAGAVEPEAPIGGRFMAKVTVVDHIFDPASGTFGVRLALPNPGLRLPAGLRCKVSFGTALSVSEGTR